MTPEEKLSIYLKHFIGTGKQTDFIRTAEINFSGKIDPAGFNRILNQCVKAKDDTYRKIAQVVFDRKDATAEELWQAVENAQLLQVDDSSQLRLASGFTTYSAMLLGALGLVTEKGRSRMPSGIQFAFSGEEDGPNWISNLDDLDKFNTPSNDLESVYIADDLVALMEGNKIDGVFMLRNTYIEAFREATIKPVQVCRIAVGYGTCMYLLGKSLPDVPAEKDPKVEPVAFSVVKQLEYLYNQIASDNNGVRIFRLNNASINANFKAFMKNELTEKSLKNAKECITSYFTLNKNDRSQLMLEIKKAINDSKLVMLLAFEPICNRLFHELRKLDGTEEIGYQYLNLSKLMNDVSTYCLYCHPDALTQPFKLLKINELLNLINAQYNFDPMFDDPIISRLLFPDDGAGDIPSQFRLDRVFREVHIRNNMLPLLGYVTRHLIQNR